MCDGSGESRPTKKRSFGKLCAPVVLQVSNFAGSTRWASKLWISTGSITG
jgi:hypothetical protein